jgi:hypothetical protein
MSCENNEAVNYGLMTERDHLENMYDVYYMRINELRNNTDDSYRLTYTYREAYDDCIYNMESITIRLMDIDEI